MMILQQKETDDTLFGTVMNFQIKIILYFLVSDCFMHQMVIWGGHIGIGQEPHSNSFYRHFDYRHS